MDWNAVVTPMVITISGALSAGVAGLLGFGMNYLLKSAQQKVALKEEAEAAKKLRLVQANADRAQEVKTVIDDAVAAVEQVWKNKKILDPIGAERKTEAMQMARSMLTRRGLGSDLNDEILGILIEAAVNKLKSSQPVTTEEKNGAVQEPSEPRMGETERWVTN